MLTNDLHSNMFNNNKYDQLFDDGTEKKRAYGFENISKTETSANKHDLHLFNNSKHDQLFDEGTEKKSLWFCTTFQKQKLVLKSMTFTLNMFNNIKKIRSAV